MGLVKRGVYVRKTAIYIAEKRSWVLDTKKFKKAVWEVRKKYSRPYLTKKQLAEAYLLYEQANENVERFKKLLTEVLK